MNYGQEKALHSKFDLVRDGRRIVQKVEQVVVIVMARAEGFAMVRKPSGMPYVCQERELQTCKEADE